MSKSEDRTCSVTVADDGNVRSLKMKLSALTEVYGKMPRLIPGKWDGVSSYPTKYAVSF